MGGWVDYLSFGLECLVAQLFPPEEVEEVLLLYAFDLLFVEGLKLWKEEKRRRRRVGGLNGRWKERGEEG